MKLHRPIPLIAVGAFAIGLWTGCSVGFDPADASLKFSCKDSTDCISGFICQNAVCVKANTGGTNCVDKDMDGYGAMGTDTSGCPKCLNEADCREDTNDNDQSIFPGAADTCDGKDNDGDGTVDNAKCDEANGIMCPQEPNVFAQCQNGNCVYIPPISTGACAGITLKCVNGMRETPPDMCQ